MPTLKAGLLQVTLFQQNCLLLWDEESKAGTVIDPGGEVERIRQAVEGQGLAIEKILLTHGHIDHAGGAAELAETLGVPVEGPHQADKFLLDGLPEAGAEFGMDDARAVTPDRWLEEGDRVEFRELAPEGEPGAGLRHHGGLEGAVLDVPIAFQTELAQAPAVPGSAPQTQTYSTEAVTSAGLYRQHLTTTRVGTTVYLERGWVE